MLLALSVQGVSPQYLRDRTMLVAAAAYEQDHARLTDWTCDACNSTAMDRVWLVEHDATHTFAYVGANFEEKAIYVVFRGTVFKSIENWVENLDAQVSHPGWCDGCGVHTGFFNSAVALFRQGLAQGIEQAWADIGEPKALYITGHSLGGGMAAALAAQMALTDPERQLPITAKIMSTPGLKRRVYTYGGPRTLTAASVDAFVQNNAFLFERMVNYDDVVPRVPPQDFTWHYHHMPTEFWWVRAEGTAMDGAPYPPGAWHECNHSGEDNEVCFLPVWLAFECVLTHSLSRSLSPSPSPPLPSICLIFAVQCSRSMKKVSIPAHLFYPPTQWTPLGTHMGRGE